MNRALAGGTVLVAALMVASVVALPLLGGIGGSGPSVGDAADDEEVTSPDGTVSNPGAGDATPLAADEPGQPVFDAGDADPVEMGPTGETDELEDDAAGAVEAGVDEGIELVQSQGVEVTQEQRAAAVDAATQSASQHQDADVEQVQAATAGAVHGSLLQAQAVDAEQVQSVEPEHVEAAVGGATDGALAQHQAVTATQLQSATWGAAHGGLAQYQHVTVEQIQVATLGAAAGAASEAGETGVEKAPTIQEAAQGSAYGTLEQYQKITVEQRQQVTTEHAQHAAAGAAAGALAGTTAQAIEQDQRITVEQRQAVTIKQVQKAATGAAKGALVQRQAVSVEQTQFAARGAGKGPLKQLQIGDVEQVQRISITQIQAASFGAATGAIVQSQEATIEQIQAAADGGSQGVIVQHQEISVTQIQKAATGAAKGSVGSAIQQQIVEIEQIQAASFGAGEGAVLQRQTVSASQVQYLAEGAAGGALVQHQEVSIEQIQLIASATCQETARAIQYQQISVTQVQILTFETAADTVEYAIAEGVDDEITIVQQIEIEVVQKVEQIDEREGEASISVADQSGDGTTVTVDAVSLSEGGFVAIYDGVVADADPEAVIGFSEYLPAGDHEDVEIELDESLSENGPIVAAVHHDTTDDETFQYAESDGAEDDPYVAPGGAPVLDGAFYTVEDESDEPEATLEVSDQTGDGTGLVVDDANASVDYAITAEYDGETIESEAFGAGEEVENESLALDPPIEENTSVEVSVVAAEETGAVAEGDVLENETIEYAVEEAPPDDDLIDSADEAAGLLEVIDYQIDAGTETEDEYVTLRNTGDVGIDFTDWTVQDRLGEGVVDTEGGTAAMEFPPNFVLEPGEDVTIVTGPGDDTDTTLHWGLESPVWNATGDDVVVLDGDGEIALEQQIGDEPEATLTVADQEANGELLLVEEANASVDFVLTATDEDGTLRATSDVFSADEGAENASIELEPPLEADATLEVAVVEADGEDGVDEGELADREPLASEEIRYAVDTSLDVEFVSCERAEVSGTFEEGDVAFASTGFYDTVGYGNTLIEDGVEFGDDVDAPFTGTVAFEIGEESSVTETEDEILVEVPDYGTFGTVLTGLTVDEETYLAAGIDYSNPDSAACFDEIRPELPTLSYENAEETDDAIAVTFGYDNPNDAALPGGAFEGATTETPPQQLEPGAGEITVEWTPDADDERLEWSIDMTAFNHTETPSAETPPAGEIAPADPGEFAVSIAEPIDPVEQGEELTVSVDVENVGDEEATETLSLSVGGQTVATDVTLGAGEQTTVPLALDTAPLEPTEYTAAVTGAADEDQAAVLIEEPPGEDADEDGVDAANGAADDDVGENGVDAANGAEEPTESDENGDEANGPPESDDAGTGDGGAPDDAGTDDAGTNDAGPDDAGTDDAGTGDTGTDDAGTDDAGTEDAADDVPETGDTSDGGGDGETAAEPGDAAASLPGAS